MIGLAVGVACCLGTVSALMAAVTVPANMVSATDQMSSISPFIDGPSLLASMAANAQGVPPGLQKDEVVRVLDANTLKLKKNGIVTLAGVRMPTPGSGNFQFPECLSYSPAYKLRQLVPPHSDVLVKVGCTTSAGKSVQAIVVRSEDSVLVNQELVRSGFGKVQRVKNSDLVEYLDTDAMQNLQARAKEQGIGIFKRCDVEEGPGFEAQFEPLELTVETQWGDDGGKIVTRQKETDQGTPENPGDRKGECLFGLGGMTVYPSSKCSPILVLNYSI